VIARAQGTNWSRSTIEICANQPPYASWFFDVELKKLIDDNIPACAQKLLIFTESYGGDELSLYQGDPNTTGMSATSPYSFAYWQGYHSAAAAWLQPLPGWTALDVHLQGILGKNAAEAPMSLGPGTGNPALSSFPLDPVDPVNGPVKSRHVLVITGHPDNPTGYTNLGDPYDANAIKFHFPPSNDDPCHPSQTAAILGGCDPPVIPYTAAATHANIVNAIKAIGDAIRCSADPCHEQFILFVGDHGDYHTGRAYQAPDGQIIALEEYAVYLPLAGPAFDPTKLRGARGTVPSISLLIALDRMGIRWPVPGPPIFHPGDVTLEYTGPNGPMTLTNFEERYKDLDDDGVVGDVEGEGVLLSFPVDMEEFLATFIDVSVQVTIHNQTATTLLMSEASLDTGAVPRLDTDLPGPCCLGQYCALLTQQACLDSGGVWGGVNSVCPPDQCAHYCGSADFNHDGDVGTDADILAFFMCLGGGCCPTCDSADFNGDGDIGTDADIASFFRVLGGGPC
jgi:hypothetical protein